MKNTKVSKELYADWHAVAPGVWRIRDVFVNVYLVHNQRDNTWVLIDCGLPNSGRKITRVDLLPRLRVAAALRGLVVAGVVLVHDGGSSGTREGNCGDPQECQARALANLGPPGRGHWYALHERWLS